MTLFPWRRSKPEALAQRREADHALARAQAEGERVEELAVELIRISTRNSFTESFRQALMPPPTPRRNGGPEC